MCGEGPDFVYFLFFYFVGKVNNDPYILYYIHLKYTLNNVVLELQMVINMISILVRMFPFIQRR